MSKTLRILAPYTILFALACSRATEPEPISEGRIVLRFEQAAATSTSARDGATPMIASAAIDTIIVRVFRPGNPITQEVARLVDVSTGLVDVSIPCVAENAKRVSVDLYCDGDFTHHGFETGVNVVAGQQTAVNIDAYVFTVTSLAVTPGLATDPEPFDLAWSGSPAATNYVVQTSRSDDFGTIEWEQSVTDTFLTTQQAPGAHYFRVVPRTDFADGPPSPTEFGYLQTSGGVTIAGFGAPAAIPGDVMTILGENLDVPGTNVEIGAPPMQMPIVSSTWGSLDVIVPRAATTAWISVTNALGSDISNDPLIVQRVAYVTSTGEWATEYVELLFGHWDDFGYSGVAIIPIWDLDTRNMGVFDVVIVANDTGTSTSDWGGGVPARAIAIAASTANVLALGEGGLAYLQLAVSSISGAISQVRNQTSYYVTTPSASVFTTPHSVTSGGLPRWVDISGNPERTVGVEIASNSPPAGVNLHACTGLTGPVPVMPNDLWSVVDFQVPDIFSAKKRLFFYGHAGNPKEFTSQGEGLLGNMMYHLYTDRAIVPPAEAASAR